MGAELGAGEWSGQIIGAVFGFGPSTIYPAAGAAIGKPEVPSDCRCK
jgi:hypothetical protein